MGDTKSQFVSRLYEEQSLPLVKFLTARFQNVDEAKEIAHEAWLRIYRLDEPQGLDNAKAFLFQTAANLSIDRIRRVKLERRHAVVDAESTHSVEAAYFAEKALQTIDEGLTELPLKCRQAFVMHRQVGRSYPEIARELGVSTSMVEKYIIQALKHFRNKLEQDSQ
ncbi:MAG: sigma-70 family RNA polymerase sigma factor [Pseudomonadota bacterium]